MQTKQLSTFYVGDYYFGVEVSMVQEVIRHQDMTRVPLAPAVVIGLINLRGQIVTAIDLRKRLKLDARETDRLPMNVVIRDDEQAVSLLVDDISDVLTVSSDDFSEPPNNLAGIGKHLIHGVYQLTNGLLLELDVQKTIRIEE